MKDERKTKKQLINELVEIRQRIAELEKLETDLKQAEQIMQEAREYAESVVETVREPLVVLDADLKVISANHSFYKTFKVIPEETKGQLLYDLGNRQWGIPRLRELLQEILPEHTIFEDFEVEHDFPTIGRRMMLLNARRMYRETNQMQLILLAIEDITERKQAEEALAQQAQELARSNAELQQFTYAISHDLQEPLLVVSGYVQLLARRYKGKLDADADNFIVRAVDGIKGMETLIKDLLAYWRAGTYTKTFEPTDCKAVFDRTLRNLQAAIEEGGAVVTHDPLPTVMADASQLLQLFQNLIGNAIKFRGEELPRVHISAEQKGNEWVFSVRDNGIGIDPKYTERIFITFERVHSRSKYPGTGIGLALCKKIVERHGGRIWVNPEQGRGSTFYFTIQILKAGDRRAHPRKKFLTPVDYTTPDKCFSGYVHNISEGGMFILTRNPLAVGSDMTLSLIMLESGVPIKVKGEVTWNGKNGMGLKFRGVDELTQGEIRSVVSAM